MVETISDIKKIIPLYNPNMPVDKNITSGFMSKSEIDILIRLAPALGGKKASAFEFGTNAGNTTAVLARYFGQIYTIDFYREIATFIDPAQANEIPRLEDVGKSARLPNVHQLYGDTTSKATRLELSILNRMFNLVLIDAGHNFVNVLNDGMLALTMVKLGGVVIIHDYKAENVGKDVMRAVDIISDIVGKVYHIEGTWFAFCIIPNKMEESKKEIIKDDIIPHALVLGDHIVKYPDKRFHDLPTDSDRTIEIPLIWDEVIKYKPEEVLEVGNVLGYYIDRKHDVVDLLEKGDDIITADIRTYKDEKKYKLIVSITTLEHVGDGKDGHDIDELGIINAINNMLELLEAGGRIIFTVPVGHNPYMDNLFKEQKIVCDNIYAYKRIDALNNWLRLPYDDIKNSELYVPYWGTANASLLCEIYKKGNSR